MYLGEPNKTKRRLLIAGAVTVPALGFLIAFWKEIRTVLGFFFGLLPVIFGSAPLTISPEVAAAFQKLFYTIVVGYLGFFVLLGAMMAQQALLPVTNLKETVNTLGRFFLFVLRRHGPAVFVKDGKVQETKDDQREGRGVVVIDFNSAILLEDRVMRRPRQSSSSARPRHGMRAVGPGLAFTRRGERIRGAVDLRPQFRLMPKVPAYTRDGIEISANAWAMFTIGAAPEELWVTYDGERRPENLRSVNFEEVSPTQVRITGLSDELDRYDRDEAHHFFHQAFLQRNTPERAGEPPILFPFDIAARRKNRPARADLPEFDPQRVFAAVYAEARDANENPLSWTDLPAQVAGSIFREVMSQVNFDQLYRVGEDGPLPLFQFKRRVRQAMRNNGTLAYRLFVANDLAPLKVRRVYRNDALLMSDKHEFINPKVLRDRGIKVIFSGFGDITPVNPEIARSRLENWRATWQSEAIEAAAGFDFAAARIRAQERRRAQIDLGQRLGVIFQQNEHSQEYLALRLFQAIEAAAADPQTRTLLPANTIEMIKVAHEWLVKDINQNPNQNPQPQGPRLGGLE